MAEASMSLKIVVLAFAVIVITTIGVICRQTKSFISYYDQQDATAQNEIGARQVEVKTSSALKTATASWPVYTNDSLGLSFKVPPAWGDISAISDDKGGLRLTFSRQPSLTAATKEVSQLSADGGKCSFLDNGASITTDCRLILNSKFQPAYQILSVHQKNISLLGIIPLNGNSLGKNLSFSATNGDSAISTALAQVLATFQIAP